MTINDLEIIYMCVNEIKKYKHVLRKHGKRKIELLEKIIANAGFLIPILICSKTKVVICGHARIQAAINLKLEKIPIIEISHLSEAQVKALTNAK